VRELRYDERLRVRLLDLDTLFQAPLAEFTETRNALAKAAGADGAAIRKIEKPTAAAWAVNQIYWRHRRVYDKLVRASARVRAAHALILKGKRVDLAPLELLHRAAVKEAADRGREMLTAAGDAASAASLNAMQETLQALPVTGPPGRLTRPLGMVGFGALGGLLRGAGLSTAAAEIVPFTPPPARARAEAERDAEREAKRARADAAARVQRRKALEAKRRALEARIHRARAHVGKLTEALAAASADLDSLDRELRLVLREETDSAD
jgi:septal ring factor EnvC (AmiA/AmiB activator)